MSKLLHLAQKVGLNGFLAGLLLAIFLAWLFPGFGATSSPIPWKPIINVGIAVVFFMYGVSWILLKSFRGFPIGNCTF